MYDGIFSVWNEQLASVGAKIISERCRIIEDLSKVAVEKNMKIAKNSAEKEELLKISYNSDISREIILENDIEAIKREFFNLLESKTQKEIEREMTLTGPHRDDLEFKLDDRDMKKFSSQGQKRTAILSLKLAELELLKKITGRKPIFLLDDVFSELDEKRQKSFFCPYSIFCNNRVV